MNDWSIAYTNRVNVERLANQTPAVQLAAKEILEQLKTIEQILYWALDPDNKDHGRYDCGNLIGRAHDLVDLGHDYRAALNANPPPKEAEDDDDDAA